MKSATRNDSRSFVPSTTPLGQPTLNPPELLGVEREPEQEVRLRVPSELRVGDLVRPVRLPLDEVGDPAPALGVDEDALINDVVGAGANRIGSDASRAVPVAVVGVDDEDGLALGAQLREVRALVLVALRPDQLHVRIVNVRPSHIPTRDREPEPSEVLALEEVIQVGWQKRTDLCMDVWIVARTSGPVENKSPDRRERCRGTSTTMFRRGSGRCDLRGRCTTLWGVGCDRELRPWVGNRRAW